MYNFNITVTVVNIMASVQSMFTAFGLSKQKRTFVWVKFVKMPKQQLEIGPPFFNCMTMLCTLKKHAFSTNQSERYIETLLYYII